MRLQGHDRGLKVLAIIEVITLLVGTYVAIIFWAVAAGPPAELSGGSDRSDLIAAVVATALAVALAVACYMTVRRLQSGSARPIKRND
jgi:hypothetical protein